MDLSGLVFCRNSLLTVSDKTQNWVFSIESSGDGLVLNKFLRFEVPSHEFDRPWLRNLYAYLRGLVGQSSTDWEGISCDEGAIYLVSEIFGSILIIRDGTRPSWRSVADKEILGSYPLYQHTFTGFESIAIEDKKSAFIGHERDPAAIVVFDMAYEPGKVSDFMAISNIPDHQTPTSISEDISGSDIHDGILYTLHRGSRQICAQKTNPPFVGFLGCRSYASTEKSGAYAYPSMTYGRAEGIAATDDKLYVILDNNGDKLISNGSTEALLFIFENPW
jgi:hypothetical protein